MREQIFNATREQIEASIACYLEVLRVCFAIGEVHRADVRASYGRRYVRVIVGTSAYSFVDRSTGNVLYPKSWKGPEQKNPRGNVLDGSWIEWHGPFGCGYVADHQAGRSRLVPMDEQQYAVLRDACLMTDAAGVVALVRAAVADRCAALLKARAESARSKPAALPVSTSSNGD